MVQKLVEKCHFMTYPTEPKQFEISEGISFSDGIFEGKVIKKFAIFPALVYVDGGDTDEARELLLELLSWGKQEFGINFSEDMIRRWAYVSDVVVESDIPLLLHVNPILNRIGESVRELVRINLREELTFQPSKIYIGIDPHTRSTEPAAFSIQHRGAVPFQDNRYFCEAPIPTNDHLKLLEQLENELMKQSYEK
jgi:hypothetical protein